MVQFFQLGPTAKGRIGEETGKAIGTGIGSVLQEAGEYKRNRGRLQQALQQIENLSPEEKKDPTRVLTSLISATAGIPGAERYVGSVFDTMSRQITSRAQAESARSRKKTSVQQPMQQAVQPMQQSQATPGQVIPQGEAYFREPAPPQSPETLFPQQTSALQAEPEMTPDELNDYAGNLVDQSGGQMDWNQAYSAAQQQNAAIRDKNDKREQQQINRQQAIEAQSQAMVSRAANSNLLSFPGAQTIAANAAFESKNAQTPEQQWQYVQTQLKEAENAYNGLKRQSGPGDPLTNWFRKEMGTYKEKEQIFKDIQPSIKYYKDKGLFNELRGILSGDLGLGAEDVETAMFPPTESERKLLDKFPMNADRIPNPLRQRGNVPIKDLFPDERYKADATGYNILKDQIKKYIQANPQANLISLRGRLNQDKKYYWGDISNALQELADEKAFATKNGRPDQVQQQQLQVIKQAPIPGLGQQFKYFLKGTK